MAEWVFVSEMLTSECFVDHDYVWSLHRVGISEIAALQKRNLHRLEVMRRDGAAFCQRVFRFRDGRASFDREGIARVAPRERQVRDCGGRFHTRCDTQV